MIKKEELIQVQDTIIGKKVSVKIEKGTRPNDDKYPEYVEIAVIEEPVYDLTTFAQRVDEGAKLTSYLNILPEDAVEIYRALGIVLGIIGA